MKEERNLAPWQYPEERWRKIVNRMSNYGNRTLVPPPAPGPSGAW